MSNDPRRLLQQAQQAASAAPIDATRWSGCISAIATLANAAGAALFRPRPAPDAGSFAVHGIMASGAGDDYWNYWGQHDPWNIAIKGTGRFQRAGEISLSHEFIAPSDYLCTAYYNDYGKRIDSGHKLTLKICDASDPIAPVTHLTLSRTMRQDPFGAREKGHIQRLWLHMQQSVQAQYLLQRMHHAAHLAEAGIEQLPYPCWIVREDRCIDFANRAAEDLMRDAGWLAVAAGYLTRVSELDEVAIQMLIADAVRGTALDRQVLFKEQGAAWPRRARLRLLPIGDAPLYAATWPHARAMMIMEIPSGAEDANWIETQLTRHYRLTPNECRVLQHLVAGRDTPAIAQEMSISAVTVKTHLRALREKTGRRTQAELMHLGFGR